MNLLTLFIVLNIINVILQTARSITTIKCGKVMASIVSALAYGLYTIVIVYTNCDLNLWAKVAVVAGANLVGVYVIKLIEEAMQKDKVWKIEVSLKKNSKAPVQICFEQMLVNGGISHNCFDLKDYIIFNCYCKTQKESSVVGEAIKFVNSKGGEAKYFATESKIL